MSSEELEKQSDFLFYATHDGKIKIQIIIDSKSETVWTTQKGMADIFKTTKQNISEHLQNIFETKELHEDSVVRKILTTAEDGKKYSTNFYNLDTIIAIGYRVNSYNATQFRKWATKILKDYLTKGYVLDDDRLKQGKTVFNKDYFDELIERIREIRASERRFYQKITDIYSECSMDYDPDSPITQTFFATVQNKLEFAITKHTAAELISTRADAKKPHMGLTSWKNEKRGGKILKTDVPVAKNYLYEDEIKELNIIVNMYLDYAELQAKRNRALKMSDWISKLNEFLKFNEYEILNHAGNIKSDVAKKIAEKEFEKYRIIQDKEHESDFDRVVKRIKENKQLPKEGDKESEPEIKKELTGFDKLLMGSMQVPPEQKEKKANKEIDKEQKIDKEPEFDF